MLQNDTSRQAEAGLRMFYAAFRNPNKSTTGGQSPLHQLYLTRSSPINAGISSMASLASLDFSSLKCFVQDTELDEGEFGMCISLLSNPKIKTLDLLVVHGIVLEQKSLQLFRSTGVAAAYQWYLQLKNGLNDRGKTEYFYVVYYSNERDLERFQDCFDTANDLSSLSMTLQKKPTVPQIGGPQLRMEVLAIILSQSMTFLKYLSSALDIDSGASVEMVVKDSANLPKISKLNESYYFQRLGNGAEYVRTHTTVVKCEAWTTLCRQNRQVSLMLAGCLHDTIRKGIGILKAAFSEFNAVQANQHLNLNYEKEDSSVYLFCKVTSKDACLQLFNRYLKYPELAAPKKVHNVVNVQTTTSTVQKPITQPVQQQPIQQTHTNPFTLVMQQPTRRYHSNRSDSDLQTDSSFEEQARIAQETKLLKPSGKIFPRLPVMNDLFSQYQQLCRQSFSCTLTLQQENLMRLEGPPECIQAFLSKTKLELLKEVVEEPANRSKYLLLDATSQEKLMLKQLTGILFRNCKRIVSQSRTNQWQIKLLNHCLNNDKVEAPMVYACEGNADWAERVLDNFQKTGKSGQKCLRLFTDIGNIRNKMSWKSHLILFRLTLSDSNLNSRDMTRRPEERSIDYYSGEDLLPLYYVPRI